MIQVKMVKKSSNLKINICMFPLGMTSALQASWTVACTTLPLHVGVTFHSTLPLFVHGKAQLPMSVNIAMFFAVSFYFIFIQNFQQ